MLVRNLTLASAMLALAACSLSAPLAPEVPSAAPAAAASSSPPQPTPPVANPPTAATPAAAKPAAARPAPFAAVVADRFATWDQNGDAELCAEEIDRACLDPHSADEAAAAIAAIKRALRSGNYAMPPLTIAGLTGSQPAPKPAADADDADRADSGEEPAGGAAPATAPASPPKKAPNFASSYTRSLQRIRSTPRTLFGDDTPDLDGCRQGPLGNCWFVAGVGAFVHRDPEAAKRLIAEVDGGYVVTFGNGQQEQVAALSPAELALCGTTGDEGLWLPVLEKAMGQIRRAANPKRYVTLTASDALSGGSSATTLRLLTGNPTQRIGLHKRVRASTTPAPAPVLAEPKDQLAAKVHEALRLARQEGRLATCSTSTAKKPPGIAGKHAYAILGYDAERCVVTIWNPHGSSRTVKGEPGLANGYPTRKGVFEVPLLEFVEVFSSVTVEVAKKAE